MTSVEVMLLYYTLREKCPNLELFLVRIQPEYRKIRTRNNSVFGHFSRSDNFLNSLGSLDKN